MKKLSGLSLLLCLLLVFQIFALPAVAAEIAPSETVGLSPEAEAEVGSIAITNGCRTIEGAVPLGGSERIVETAQAAFVYELNTNTVLYSYNPDTTMSPGAMTKILTAIVAIENGNLEDEVTISTANYRTLPTTNQLAKLKEGEVMTLKDLLYCMIVRMANDAALTIAEHIAGSQDAFVTMMNEKAREIGCTGSVFANCHGIDSAGQYSTARDIARIVQYAIKNSDFKKLFGTNKYVIEATNKSDERSYTTQNYLLEQTDITKYIDYSVTGGVATYTNSSGACLACTAEENGLSLIIVIMGCKRIHNSENTWIVEYYGNFDEVWDLLAFAFDGYRICSLLHDGQAMSQFTVAGGENHVVGQSHTDMDVVLPKEAKMNSLILKYAVEGGGLTAPVAKDQRVATVEIWYRNSCVTEAELFAMSEVRAAQEENLDIRSVASRDDSNLSELLSFLGIVCLIIFVPFTIYLVVNHIRRTIAMNRRRRRRASRRRSR